MYRSSQNYYRQSRYSWECVSPTITVTVTVLKFGRIQLITIARYRLGVRSHPFISIGSQIRSWKSFELIFQNYRYRFCLKMFWIRKAMILNMAVQG